MKHKNRNLIYLILCVIFSANSQDNLNNSKFKQLHEELPTPNVYRTASGAPGHEYYQQQADYLIEVELDEENNTINGYEVITYTNNSPDILKYLWIQLEQNVRAKNSHSQLTSTNSMNNKMEFSTLKRMHDEINFDGGFKIEYVKDQGNKELTHTINETMMRIDLPKPLKLSLIHI